MGLANLPVQEDIRKTTGADSGYVTTPGRDATTISAQHACSSCNKDQLNTTLARMII
jgi:hypothetical protein